MLSFPIVVILLFLGVATEMGECLQCYECSTRIDFGIHDVCSSGKKGYLRRVECFGPSVCATYTLTTEKPGYPMSTIVNRGCQAIRYGATCEDIFNDLRRRGSVFPGHHECSTCSTDLCNSTIIFRISNMLMIITALICIKSFIMYNI
ncbi:hypothetical protein HHI36_015560 [Cryptolaemus montrouzieri]|uniref:Protein sleepless n=1 Tax=Cryptolaemus montrouzieri TaxID=559131 RepID=A0ABD2N5Z9_9CUCU